MEWPYRRFLKAFDAFQRRQVCDQWEQRRAMHVSALYANTNLDGTKEEPDVRGKVLPNVEAAYDRIIAAIWNGNVTGLRSDSGGSGDAEEEAMWNSTFMRAGRTQIEAPEMPGERAIGALPA